METIIATVIRIIQVFLIFKPTAKVLFMGSTASRTRLYRGIINKYLAEAEQIYEIHGILIGRMSHFKDIKPMMPF